MDERQWILNKLFDTGITSVTDGHISDLWRTFLEIELVTQGLTVAEIDVLSVQEMKKTYFNILTQISYSRSLNESEKDYLILIGNADGTLHDGLQDARFAVYQGMGET